MVEKTASALAGEIEQALLARLPALKMTVPRRIAGRSAMPAALRARYPDAVRVAATARAAADLLWDAPGAAAMFHPYTPAIFQDIEATLAEDGVFFFATLGPQTLLPLRPLCSPATTAHAFASWPALVDLGDALIAAGLARPVLDRELLTFAYADATAALAELAQDGWFDATACGPNVVSMAAQALTAADGSAAVPFEIFYGVAWNAVPAVWRPLRLVR